jgi:hypothetical protein
MRTKIHGHFWKFEVLEDDEFSKRFEEDKDEFTYAITLKDRREVYFRQSTLNIEVMRHEVFHVYASLTFTDSADVSRSADEEIYAEMFGVQGELMVKLSKRILKKLTISK